MTFEKLAYHNWRPVVGHGSTHEEQPSIQVVKCWVWKGLPVEVEGTVFRRRRKDKPDDFFYIFSVPNPKRGYSDPFDDYYIRSPRIDQLYALCAEVLVGEVLDILKKQVDEARRAYNWALDEQAAALKACTPFVPELCEESAS